MYLTGKGKSPDGVDKYKPSKKKAKQMKLKRDRRNYRLHDSNSKKIIGQSLDQCGAGRSILADSTGEIIAGNGVFEQAEARGIKTRFVETDGTELVVVVRKDLKPGDDKRKLLALADNAASDASSWNAELVRQDWNQNTGAEWGINPAVWCAPPVAFQTPDNTEYVGPEDIDDFDDSGLPEELQGEELKPVELERIEGDFKTECGRVIITFPWDKQNDVMRLLGVVSLDKIVYSIEEILGEK
jgi:hypothetical protein